MANLGEKLLQLDNLAEFQNLSYGEQVGLRSKIASDYLAKDTTFQGLTPQDQYALLQSMTLTRPALRDKALEAQGAGLVEAAKKGDKRAQQYMSDLVAESALISNSMLANLFGSKIIAPLIAKEKDVRRSPELEASQFWASDPRDRMRLSDYLESETQQYEGLANRTKMLKIAATVLPTMAEFLLLMPLTGASSAPAGIGKLVMRGITSAASKAVTTGSKLLWGLAGAVAHGSTTALVGVARENLLGILNKAPKDPNIAELLKKNAKWFGGYFLGDALMNMALDTVIPLARGMKLAFLPKGQTGAAFKGLTQDDIMSIMDDVVTGKGIDPYMRARLPKATQLAFDNMATSVAVNKYLPSKSPEEIFTFLANSQEYAVAQGLKSKTLQLREVGGASFIDFDDYKAATAWLTNTYETQGKARIFPVATPKQLADLKVKSLAEAQVPLASLTRRQYVEYVKDGWERLGYASSHDMIMKQSGELLEKRFGVKLSASNEDWFKAVAGEWNIDVKPENLIWDNGTKGPITLQGVVNDKAYAMYSTREGMHHFDFTGIKELTPEAQKLVVVHELRHARDATFGYQPMKTAAEDAVEPHMATWTSFNPEYVHKLAVEGVLREGYQVPEAILKDYPDLMPRMFRPEKLSEAAVKLQAGASRNLEIREILGGSLRLKDERKLDLLAKLAAVNPETRMYSRENLEKFAKEYLLGSGAKPGDVANVRVEFVHSKASQLDVKGDIPLEDVEGVASRAEYFTDKNIRITAYGKTFTMPIRLAGDLAEGTRLRNLVGFLDNLEIFPVKTVPNVKIKQALARLKVENFQVMAKATGSTKRMVKLTSEEFPEQVAGFLQKKGSLWEYTMTSGLPARGTAPTLKEARQGLLVAFQKQGVELTSEVRATTSLAEKGFLAQYPKLLQRQRIFTPAWVEYAAGELDNATLKVDAITGAIEVNIHQVAGDLASPIARTITVDSYEVLAKDLIARTVDEKYLRGYLNDQGLKLVVNRETKQVSVLARAGEKPLYQAPDVHTLLTQNPELMPKIPHDLGPQVAAVTPGQVEVKYTKGILTGSYEEVLKELDRFENRALRQSKMMVRANRQGYLTSSQLSKQFEVYIPEINERRVFNDMAGVKEYLGGGWKQYDEIEKTALQKGMRLVPANGKWLAYDSTGKVVQLADEAALHAHIAKVPRPEWMPELSGMPSEVVEPMKRPPEGTFKPEFLALREPKTAFGVKLDVVSQFWRDPIAWFRQHVEKGGDPELLKAISSFEDVRQLMRAEDNRLGQLAHTLFLDSAGKPIGKDRRIYIGEWLRAAPDQKVEVIRIRGLTEDELHAGELLRGLWGAEAGKGLHGKFGIVGFIDDYFPKMNQHFNSNRAKIFSDGDVRSYMRDVFGENVPGKLDAFFKHARVSDVLSLSQELDPLAAVMKYGAIGHRELYMGPYWDEIGKVLEATTDDVGKARLFAYMGDIMGLPHGGAEKTLQNATLEVLKKFGVEHGLGLDVVKLMTSFAYMSALGFRPMLAVRNTLQIFNTLAPSLGLGGNKWVSKAMKKIAGDSDGSVFNGLRAKGIMMANLPVPGGETLAMLDPEAFVGKFLNKGLSWYRNSDEFTRAVSFWASKMKFDDAIERYQASMKGALNMSEENFLEMSGLNMLPPDVKNQALGLIREGKWYSASDLYATRMTDWTMFPYRSGMTPMAFRSLPGKLFGMMGHYPLYYVENIRRGLKYGSTASKAAFASTFLWNSAVIYGALQYGFGQKADDFIPWVPMQFTGGPLYQLTNSMIQSVGRGYKGRQARAELFGLTSTEGKLAFDPRKGSLYQWFVPGGFELRKISDGVKFAEAGNWWSAFLSFTGGTPVPSWLDAGVKAE